MLRVSVSLFSSKLWHCFPIHDYEKAILLADAQGVQQVCFLSCIQISLSNFFYLHQFPPIPAFRGGHPQSRTIFICLILLECREEKDKIIILETVVEAPEVYLCEIQQQTVIQETWTDVDTMYSVDHFVQILHRTCSNTPLDTLMWLFAIWGHWSKGWFA